MFWGTIALLDIVLCGVVFSETLLRGDFWCWLILTLIISGIIYIAMVYKLYDAACLFRIRSRLYTNDFKIMRMDPWDLLNDKVYRKKILKMIWDNLFNMTFGDFR